MEIERFPPDFMFQLTKEEFLQLKKFFDIPNWNFKPELQAKEPRKRERRPIGFIVPDEKKG